MTRIQLGMGGQFATACLLFAGSMLGAFADDASAWQSAIDLTGPSPPEQESPNDLPVLKLVPAAEPVPAMKFRFWPDRFQLQPGNAMVRFQRAGLLSLDYSQQNPDQSREFWDNWNRWVEMPIGELPVQEVRQSLDRYRLVLRELRNGRLLADSNYDLPIEDIQGTETIEFLLPEFQTMRSLARLLQLEIRFAIAEGRIDDAILILQTGFRLGESTGQAIDYLVARLVGLAISGVMLSEVENLIQADGCPNLYWALASLPRSVSEVGDALQFEASIMSRVFESLQDLPGPGQPADVWESRIIELLVDLQKVQAYGLGEQSAKETNARLLAGLAIVGLTEYSRNHLIEMGIAENVVREMSPAEAVVRSTAWSVRVIQDEFVKWTYLPERLREPYLKSEASSLDRLQSETQTVGDLATVMAGLLLPSIQAANAAGVRSQQAIAHLVTIEAIRHHVANTGQVPDQLEQLKDLPGWQDPFTGEAFGYQKTGSKSAVLHRAPRWKNDTETSVILQFK